ncbi:MAG: methyl-accepting chemotaxis protein [Syntrophobacteraceae bacterium]
MVSYYKSSSAIQHTCQDQLSQLVESTRKSIDLSISYFKLVVTDWKNENLLAAASQSGIEDQNAIAACSRLKALMTLFQSFERINLANKQGQVIASSDPVTVGILVSDRGYFKEALSGKLNVSEVMMGKTTGKPVVMISAPVRDGEEIVGVLSAVLDMASLGEAYVEPVKIGKKGYAYMYGQDGLMLSHPDKTLNYKFNMSDTGFGKEMLSTKQGILAHLERGVEKITAYAPLKEINITVAVTADVEEILAPIRSIRWINTVVSASIILLIGLVIFLVAKSITNPIRERVIGLMDAADEVSSGSGQVASASQELAEGASEQAASLEETSSSLEEMASMTKQNAENANQANALMNKTRQVVEQANGSMARLTASMDEISKASEATSKIIKTIDEIAFQTNLLALNAAVEAARAGEAGAGFAVVADEVRNLAMRAAEAAKNTADLIEGTVKKIKEGSEVVQKTNTEFSEVQTSSARMEELVGEISAASVEQAQGIEQISKAVSEMDKVVQTNSANAEESASASEEMSAQAEQMKQFVGELAIMVGGANGRSTIEGATASLKKVIKEPKIFAAYDKKANGHFRAGDGKASVPLGKRNSGPEQIIPFDDAEVSDF